MINLADIVTFFITLIVTVIAALIADRLKKRREGGENVPVIVENESDEGEVLDTLKRAYFGLKKQRAAGFGPWLTCLIERADGDRALALAALWRTRDELTGSRFNLDGLDEAIRTLEDRA